MSKYLSWQECNKEITEVFPFSGKEIKRKIEREIVYPEDKVKKVWFWGGGSPNPNMPLRSYISILGKNDERFEKEITSEEMNSLDIPEVDAFIDSL